jgi:hypothetical protein
MHSRPHGFQDGFVFVMAVLIMAILFVVAGTLLFQSRTEHLIAANEHDHLAALAHAEAGLAWAQRRILDADNMTSVLRGPDGANATDDHLLGLRDLSLTSTSEFTDANEASASAIVERDFDGQGPRSWEAIRLDDVSGIRALVYVRVDDNHDDDPDDPTHDNPLLDRDAVVRVTAVAEYPAFVDASGVEQVPPVHRGRARRTLVASFGVKSLAIISDRDIDFVGGEVCGECGSIHANQDLTFAGGTSVCGDATASGSLDGSVAGVAGDAAGSVLPIVLPVINPWDDRYVPSLDVFARAGDTELPPGLRCPEASATDPGASKYFALVGADGPKGEVWKAYRDFVNARWTWRLIDDLGDGVEVVLDDCGRAPGDPGYGGGDAGPINDGSLGHFYGFSGAKLSWKSCTPCADTQADASLCGLANNDFNTTGFYPAGGGTLVAWPPLPGNFQPDGNPDYSGENRIFGSDWIYAGKTVYSPLYGAVIWVLGSVRLQGNAGDSGNVEFLCSGEAGCVSTVLPHGTWPASLIAVGDVDLSGSANVSAANPDAGYDYLLISGRDVKLSGNTQEDTAACGGSCASTPPSDIARIAGAIAAHEQIEIGGSPNVFGMLVAEEAIDCSNDVNGQTKINGTPEIHYDCEHPPDPWLIGRRRIDSWQEVE